MKGITAIGHVALKVKDIERSVHFYTKVMEFPEMLRSHFDDGSLFLIYLRVTDTQFLELFPNAVSDHAPGLEANAVHHMCLEVDKMEPVVERLIANGITSFARWTPELVLEHSDKPVINNGGDRCRQCWLTDPDGNRIELMEMSDNCIQYEAVRRLRAEELA